MKHIKGNIFDSGADAILHQVNCQGVMGAGLAKQIKEKFPEVYAQYKAACNEDKRWRRQWGWPKSNLLGNILVSSKDWGAVDSVDKQVIVNLFSQDRYGCDGHCYTEYDALRRCLERVNERFIGKTVAIPYGMGCGLAGGDWNVVSEIIQDTLVDCDVILYEYDKNLAKQSVDELISNATQTCEEVNKSDVSKDINDLVCEKE